MGVEAVGVEHDGHLGRATSSRAKAKAPSLRPRPGPDHERAAALGQLEHLFDPAAVCAPSSSGSARVIASSSRWARIGCAEAGTQAVT